MRTPNLGSTASAIIGNRRWLRGLLGQLAKATEGDRILEIGSGKPVDGGFPYSMVDLFEGAGEFVMSDIDPSYGHMVVDLTDVPFTDRFDVVVCISVLEHIPDVDAAVSGIEQSLRPGGLAAVSVPAAYPLHDEPRDFWRFTEHGLRHLFRDFEDLHVEHRGWRRLPSSLFLTARAPSG